MNKEAYFISLFGHEKMIGDDAVILENMNQLCVSQDAFFENVHFRRDWMSLYDIGRKAMLVNLSDAIVMNARPRYALLTVAMPRDFTRAQMRELAAGLRETAEAYGVAIVGGDTIANVKLDISVTILAECPDPLRRTGLKEGDLLAYTGRLGSVRLDLQRLLRGGRVGRRSRFIHPILRDRFFCEAAPFMRCAMDISDGLFTDLQRLHDANRLGFRFFSPIPKAIGCSGEEFEILFAFDPRYEARIRAVAQKCRTPLTIFAEAARTSYKNPCRPHHF
ncbi:thiamine-phosphate kinase [Hydrogenimonas sp. SS33]|uniref:thiamine-phosphate kinase n=1 Tax=Hydrogenimonas leucolamina TaxID=2954236 RepID=UPI00336BF18D